MNKITIKYLKEEYQYLELETLNEFYYYNKNFNNNYEEFIKNLLLSDVEVKKWDHELVEGENSSLFYTSVVLSKLKNEAPLITMERLSRIKAEGLKDIIEKYGSVCIDMLTGSYRPPFNENDIVLNIEKI